MKLNDQEVATVLAALRERQAQHPLHPVARRELEDIATNGGELEPLSSEEIDALCERLNITPEKKPIGKLAGLLAEALPIISAVAHPDREDDAYEQAPSAHELEGRIKKALRKARKAWKAGS